MATILVTPENAATVTRDAPSGSVYRFAAGTYNVTIRTRPGDKFRGKEQPTFR